MLRAMAAHQKILFYRQGDKYGEFSNFYPSPFRLDGMDWPTVEHYFQAKKFPGTPHEAEICAAKSCAEAKRMGNDRWRGLRPDWEAVRYMCVYLSEETQLNS
eukprot:m.38687 g.38687  ORF g.38687 m.38687 type:complete len:102 (+) comp10019_c0_seq2:55-360(+)